MNYATIPGFEALSKQQLFDMTLTHIRNTRTQSITECAERENRVVCSYKGTGCAARPFLTDAFVESLEPGIDSMDWLNLAGRQLVPEKHSGFVYDLQQCHDTWHKVLANGRPNPLSFMAHFGEKMHELAYEHGLAYAPKDTRPGESAM